MAKHTPMMQQYLRIKASYQDAFLFFRLGDFYELFYDDAINAARELEITLTKRDASKRDPIPMCGVPHHSAERYIKTLIDKGYKVAICEQVEDPKEAKGVVKREVVQLITPGTVMESSMLQDRESNFIASLSTFEDKYFVIIYHDLSTGESQIVSMEDDFQLVIHELAKYQIKEVVVSSDLNQHYYELMKQQLPVVFSKEDQTSFIGEFRHLYDDLTDERMIETFSRLLNYIMNTQKRSIHHLQKPEVIQLNQFLSLDMYSKRNLELTETMMKKEKYGSLFWVLDKTVTAMGARTLKKWMERPLLNKHTIETRLDIVTSFYESFIEREALREALQSVYDLERLAGRISFGNVHARDLIQLKHSLLSIPKIKNILGDFSTKQIKQLNDSLEYPEEIVTLLEKSIVDEPPISIKEGNIIKDGFNEQLDQFRYASRNGKKWLATLEIEEKKKTDIKSLKIGFNRVFGYYIEVTNANKHLVPEDRYERKQTLTNAERYITPELKEKEALILKADEESVELEYELFINIREQLKSLIENIQNAAKVLSEIDVFQSFATVSERNNYVRPTFSEQMMQIKNSRHPVIEKVMAQGNFVPNDIYLDDEKNILIITGPNMAGKSTYMRQLALTVIMGQIGCYVPADEAMLTIVDSIFTRIGAADDLVRGQSTFMVEMTEANHAISNATDRSLILLDEIGRGTSTYDGMALAQAIVEYIHEHIGAKTLFSTHYHELTQLEDSLKNVKNIYVRAEEYDDQVVFLHKVEEGRANKSYGIQVAQLAQLPNLLISRANDILQQLEANNEMKIREQEQLSFFPSSVTSVQEDTSTLNEKSRKIMNKLKKLKINEMTPMESLNILNNLQKELSKEKQD